MMKNRYMGITLLIVVLLCIPHGSCKGKIDASRHKEPTSQPVVSTYVQSELKIRQSRPVIQPGSSVYLILPVKQAKALSTTEKKFIDNLATIYAGENPFADITSKFQTLRAKHYGEADKVETDAIDIVLREIELFRSVFEGKSVLIKVPEGKVSFPAAGWADDIETALRSYGYVFLELRGDTFHPASPPKVSRAQWEQCKTNRILTGKWKGALHISENEILLPGLKCFQLENKSSPEDASAKKQPDRKSRQQHATNREVSSISGYTRDDFVDFMKDFYSAYLDDDWAKMRSLAAAEEHRKEYFEKLVKSAKFLAKPGMKDSNFTWSDGRFLSSVDLVKIALCIIASEQGVHDLKRATLTKAQRENIIEVQQELHRAVEVCKDNAVAARESISLFSRYLEEAEDKLASEFEISQLLKDALN